MPLPGMLEGGVQVSQWYVYPRDMCIPAHISLVICVPPVGIHKTLKLCTGLPKASRKTWLKFQPIQNINGRRSECDWIIYMATWYAKGYYWFEIVFGKCLARRQRLPYRPGIPILLRSPFSDMCIPTYQNICLPLRLWALFWNILLIRNCTRLHQGIHISQNSDRSDICRLLI